MRDATSILVATSSLLVACMRALRLYESYYSKYTPLVILVTYTTSYELYATSSSSSSHISLRLACSYVRALSYWYSATLYQ